MFSPVVSFIIPVLNGERDIARCLTSIQKQERSAKWYEIIVVDNGSTDRSHAIVRGFGCYLEVLPDVTVAALRNRGAFVACGKYLAFVDADVELSANWLGNAITVFQDASVVAAGSFRRLLGRRHGYRPHGRSINVETELLLQIDTFHGCRQ